VAPDFDELRGFAKRIIRFSLSELEGSDDTTLSVNSFSLDWHEDDPEDGTSNHRQHTRNSDSLDTGNEIRHEDTPLVLLLPWTADVIGEFMGRLWGA
jgi:hypothetical protein